MAKANALQGLVVETGELVKIGPAHPVADLFPMLSGEDLDEFIASVQAQGQLQPVVLDRGGHVLDGRNRVVACDRLGLQPTATIYEGEDPAGYALAVNVARRHLTKGQQAMIVAKAFAANGFKHGEKQRVAQQQQVSTSRIRSAAAVLDHAPDLAGAVIAGSVSLDDAYRVARDRKRAAAEQAAQTDRLRSEAPDLWDLVAEERMPLDEAWAAYQKRTEEQRAEAEREQRDRLQAIAGVRDGLSIFTSSVPGLLALCPEVRHWPIGLADLDRADKAITALREKLG